MPISKRIKDGFVHDDMSRHLDDLDKRRMRRLNEQIHREEDDCMSAQIINAYRHGR